MPGKHAREIETVARPQVTVRPVPDMEAVRSRHRLACMAGEHAHHAGEGIPVQVERSWQDVSGLHDALRVLARDVLVEVQEHHGTEGLDADPALLRDDAVARAAAALSLTPAQALAIDWLAP